MLQQLQNLTSDDIIHGYQTCPLIEFFSEDRCLNGCNVSFAVSQIEDCLELNFRYVDYQTLAHLSCNSCVYWISVRATRAQHFFSVRESISASTRFHSGQQLAWHLNNACHATVQKSVHFSIVIKLQFSHPTIITDSNDTAVVFLRAHTLLGPLASFWIQSQVS